MSGPPDSPGWMFASVSINPVSCSDEPTDESCAVIDRPSGDGSGGVARRAGTAGVADGGDGLAHCDPRRVGELDGGQTGGTVELQPGDVVRAVVPEHLRAVGLAVAQVGDADVGRALEDVVVRQHRPVEVSTIPVPAASAPR